MLQCIKKNNQSYRNINQDSIRRSNYLHSNKIFIRFVYDLVKSFATNPKDFKCKTKKSSLEIIDNEISNLFGYEK